MSSIILPGDPPPNGKVAMLSRELMAAKVQAQHLFTLLVEVVAQHGIESKLSIGPPTMQHKQLTMSIEPTETGGAVLTLVAPDAEADNNNV